MHILDLTSGGGTYDALVTGTKSQVAKFDNTGAISIGDTTIKISTSIRVLGVTIDQYLTFDDPHHQSCRFL